MANIYVTDAAQVSGSFELSDSSALSLAGLKTLKFSSVPIVSDFAKPADQSSLDSVAVEIGLTAPSVLIGNSGVVNIQAGANASFTLRTCKQKSLFDDDEFAPPVEIQAGECWAGLSIDVSLQGSIGATAPVGLGAFVKAGTSLSFGTFFHLPVPGSAMPSLQTGMKMVLENYSVPFTAAQLLSVPMGIAHVRELSGSVGLGAFYAVPLTLNPLASAHLPFNFALEIGPRVVGAVGGSASLAGDFTIRTFRSAENKLVVGLYKKRATMLSASLTISAGMQVVSTDSDETALSMEVKQAPGIQSSTSEPDILGKLLGILTPGANLDDLGVDRAQKDELNAALKQCTDRSLSIAVNAVCTAANSDEAAVIYELDLSRDERSKTEAALTAALRGDWSLLQTLTNAKMLRHVLKEVNDRHHKININLLGLYNATSVADYLKSTTVLQDENGQISMVDKASAETLSAGTAPYLAKADKLRFALAQSFVATISYGACKGATGFNAFSVRQSMLEYHAQANAADLYRQTALLKIFQINLSPDLDALVQSKVPLIHDTFYLDTAYDLFCIYRLFYEDVNQRKPHSPQTLDRIGRDTRIALLDPKAANSLQRRLALSNDDIWNAMNSSGNIATFSMIAGLAKLDRTAIQAIGADWIDIRWWSDAMQGLTPHLTAVLTATSQSISEDATHNAALLAAHAGLKDALAKLARKTNSAFGDGWPIAVIYQLATRQPGCQSSVEVEVSVSVNGKFQHQAAGLPIAKSNATA